MKKFLQSVVICFEDTSSVKGGHKISLILAQKLHQLGFICVPGWQLCRNCYKKALSEETPNEESAENYDINVDILLDKDEACAILDESLEKLGQSPVKIHGLKKCSRVPYIDAKLQDTVSNLNKTTTLNLWNHKR